MTRARASITSAVFDEIASAIGGEAASSLMRAFGGERLYVPRAFPDDHPVVVAIGATKAAVLAESFHGTRLELPIRLKRRLIVREMASRDPRPSNDEIARAVGVTVRTIYEMLNEGEAMIRIGDRRQPDLFQRPG